MPTLETLDYTIRIGSTPTFLYFDLYLYSAYAAHYIYLSYIIYIYYIVIILLYCILFYIDNEGLYTVENIVYVIFEHSLNKVFIIILLHWPAACSCLYG